jgi:hypothetical protein
MASKRKLRAELQRENDNLNVLRRAINPDLDVETAKIVAGRIRDQARTCLHLLDEYQASVPKRMQSYAAKECQPLREDLEGTILAAG